MWQICPKHVEYFIEVIWEIVFLVGFYYKNIVLVFKLFLINRYVM